MGLTQGFQWLDGSFTEHVEIIKQRPPNDIDVVSFVEAHAINAHIDEDMDIKVLMTRAGEGRPRYLLLSLPEGLDRG